MIDDLPTFFDGSIERLPACLTSNESTVTVDHEFGDRLRLVKSLAAGDANPIIVASVPALLQPLPSRAALDGQSRRIKAEQTLDVDDLTTWLTEQGFHETSAVELPGEFSSRGGIVDVFAPDWAGPVRIELFDDEVESLRQFDPGTQRSVADINQIEITVLDNSSLQDGHLADFLPEETVVLFCEPEQLSLIHI